MTELEAIRDVLRSELERSGTKPATASKAAGLGKNTAWHLIERGKSLRAETLVRLVRDGAGLRFDDFAHAVERRLQESGQ